MEAQVSTLLNRQDIWLARQQPAQQAGMATGFAELDRRLVAGGWPQIGVVELLGPALGISPLVASLLRQASPDRWQLCLAPPVPAYGPGLQALGVDLARFICIDTDCHKERLWALEQALGSGRCALVLAWLEAPTLAQVRRLQLAAERGQCLLVLHLPPTLESEPHPVPLRLKWQLTPEGYWLSILKQRGGWPQPAFFQPRSGSESAPSVLIQGPW
ncbi:translesion DNA synthesis-associated protein ImuA [Ferrimonas balearica]|uniref:translesion DNA synthesis-associated protein ImuA n=1 Tax=Ferrimonas balearica TaxID=44012 RepID=UPI001C99B949|nr:translesion DNA synthesis-associated protein ImuA [Ferrimonas balearica]MBY5991935.1 translesion DNA synthesis-associated protein ImuA [Ferrimonas balearica]